MPLSDRNVGSRNYLRDRAIRLFRYLRELVGLRSKTVRDLSQYDMHLWLADVPREPECRCIAWAEEQEEVAAEEVWLEVSSPDRMNCPVPPEELQPWLNASELEDPTLEYPELREQIEVPTETNGPEGNQAIETETRLLADHPHLKPLWDSYVENKWWPWAEEERRALAVQEIYAKLFSLYQRQQRLGERYEVVLGMGCLAWITHDGQQVKRHIVTAQTSLSFDANRGVITVSPAAEGAFVRLEEDMLDPRDRPRGPEAESIVQRLQGMGDDIWGPIQADVLPSWVHALSADGQFSDTVDQPSGAGTSPVVHTAPALILRRRSEGALLETYSRIIEQLESGIPVPEGIAPLVEIDESVDANLEPQGEGEVGVAGEIYFPLEANSEQLRVVGALNHRQGVLVQGPPGTGKSHTIANLVCHLLATGNRVLVSSHTARALRVLREKFPETIKPLCVVLLGNDRDSMQEMESAVQGISWAYDGWDRSQSAGKIDALDQQLDSTRRREAGIRGELRELREKDTYNHSLPFGDYTGTTQTIAERIRQEASSYDWLNAKPDPAEAPPLTNGEAIELLESLRSLTADVESTASAQASLTVPLLTEEEFKGLVEQEQVAIASRDGAKGLRDQPVYAALLRMPEAAMIALAEEIRALVAEGERWLTTPADWARLAVMQLLRGQESFWRQLLELSENRLDAATPSAVEASELRIAGLEGRDHQRIRDEARSLLQHLEAGGTLGLGPFRAKPVKQARYVRKKITVNGAPCTAPDSLRSLVLYLDIEDALASLDPDQATF